MVNPSSDVVIFNATASEIEYPPFNDDCDKTIEISDSSPPRKSVREKRNLEYRSSFIPNSKRSCIAYRKALDFTSNNSSTFENPFFVSVMRPSYVSYKFLLVSWHLCLIHDELFKEIQDSPMDINAIVAKRRRDFTGDFFRHLTLLSETYDSLEDRDGLARLGARCLSAVSAFDNTLDIVDTLDTAQEKFDEILNSPSVDAACDKIKSLAKSKELDSSLILLINGAWASAKDSPTIKNEVKDIMYRLYKATQSSLRSIAPKEIKLLKYLLNITDPEERFSALATAFCPGDNPNNVKESNAIYTTPKELHKWIKIMLDAYNLSKEESEIREARKLSQPVVIQRLFILKETIEVEYLEQSTKTETQEEEEVDESGDIFSHQPTL
ncbi:PREDICTED: uncharacterized protein At4g37920, chloroplastic-like [Erythranthe guttata]|uniref:uncharacterized protein At4g37920, chloroplastic-like n=1 Tax=Erythranthe guttata TaxID=4155 RepID=UPI00064DADB7|nr:PREDICTED: uncharacterized protein At4g37920, chloroplastic-like [Erythranthe guttata]|eukprot:XP_012842829.1 PREDICTED: uncharacterized protein At4g37920, chloroplastic-like [Erythranthe guttata]